MYLGRIFWKGAACSKSITSSWDKDCSINRQKIIAFPNSLKKEKYYLILILNIIFDKLLFFNCLIKNHHRNHFVNKVDSTDDAKFEILSQINNTKVTIYMI